jgi:hypothetical protein
MNSKISKPDNVADIISHLKDVDYPVTGKKFMEACDNMSDVSEEQRAWVRDNIVPGKTYVTPEAIKHDLSLRD